MSTHLKIITSFDAAFEEIGSISARTMRAFAGHWGHDFEALAPLATGRPPAWSKIRLLCDEIRKGTHDWILWVDADACFVRLDEDLFREPRDEKLLWMALQRCDKGTISSQPGVFRGGRMGNALMKRLFLRRQPGLRLLVERPNTGVMLVRSHPNSLRFLEDVWRQEDLIHHKWWEQAAVHRLLGFEWEVSGGRRANQVRPEALEMVGWLGEEWNSVPTSADQGLGPPATMMAGRPVIIHAAGMRRELRRTFLEEAAANVLESTPTIAEHSDERRR